MEEEYVQQHIRLSRRRRRFGSPYPLLMPKVVTVATLPNAWALTHNHSRYRLALACRRLSRSWSVWLAQTRAPPIRIIPIK
jgi:hypothetical protein